MNEYKLFTVGPAQMYKRTLSVRNRVVPYFRTKEFSDLMLENEQFMKCIMDANEDSRMITLTASGSGAMEATVINCFSKDDRLLIVSGGTFGERFEKICTIHEIPFETIKLGPDEALTEMHLKPFEGNFFSGMLTQMHETYTGQLYDINMLHKFCNRNGMLLVVDIISSFLCDPFSMKQMGVDAAIVSSQKGLCLAPGLSFVMLSNRMIRRVEENDVKSLYFDFKEYLINSVRGQTPFTPAVGICMELNDMLKYINEQGVNERLSEVRDRCNYFRGLIADLPVIVPDFPLSNAITPVRFRKNIATEFFNYLKDYRHIMVNPVGGPLGNYSIRVAHIGDLNFYDYDILVKEMKAFFEM